MDSQTSHNNQPLVTPPPLPGQPTPTSPSSEQPTSPPLSPDAHVHPVVSGYNTLAIIGLVFSIVMPLIGLVISVLALRDVKKTHQQGYGLALAGIIISVAQMVIAAVGIIILLALTALSDTPTSSTFDSSNVNRTPVGGSSQASARDVQRKTDISKLQVALESYYADHGAYPTAELFRTQEWAKSYATKWDNDKKAFVDPLGQPYFYDVRQAICDAKGCDSYELSTLLETPGEFGDEVYAVQSEAKPALDYQEN